LDGGVQDLSCTDGGADIDEVIEVGSAQALAPHGEMEAPVNKRRSG